MAHLGELIAELRQDRGLTQKELGDILCVSSGTISNYENGVHLPDVDKVIALANYFHVTTDYLSVALHLISLSRCCSELSPTKRLLVT